MTSDDNPSRDIVIAIAIVIVPFLFGVSFCVSSCYSFVVHRFIVSRFMVLSMVIRSLIVIFYRYSLSLIVSSLCSFIGYRLIVIFLYRSGYRSCCRYRYNCCDRHRSRETISDIRRTISFIAPCPTIPLIGNLFPYFLFTRDSFSSNIFDVDNYWSIACYNYHFLLHHRFSIRPVQLAPARQHG